MGGVSPPITSQPPSFEINLEPCKRDREPKAVVVIPSALRNQKRLPLIKETISVISKSKLVLDIVIVGNFTSKSKVLLNRLKQLEKVRFIQVEEEKDSPAYSRNIGINESLFANADVTFFLDDDVLIKDLKVINKLLFKACDSIALPLVKSTSKTWFDFFHDYDGTLNGVYLNKKILLYATTCCTAISNSIFLDGIRFDTDFKLAAGEDIDFSLKALFKGYPAIPVDDIIIHHEYEYAESKSLEKFIKRYFRYGVGNYFLLKKHPYYYTLLSKCKERPTIKNINSPNITLPKECKPILKIVKNLFEGVNN